jgi:UDP-N-acetylmuramoylalanine-D-glutamate ligase
MTGQGAEKLGYLGLGMMGFPMARRLLNAGHDVVVWDRSAARRLYWSRLVRSLRPIRATSRATPVSFSCASPTQLLWSQSCSVATVLRQRLALESWSWIFH